MRGDTITAGTRGPYCSKVKPNLFTPFGVTTWSPGDTAPPGTAPTWS